MLKLATANNHEIYILSQNLSSLPEKSSQSYAYIYSEHESFGKHKWGIIGKDKHDTKIVCKQLRSTAWQIVPKTLSIPIRQCICLGATHTSSLYTDFTTSYPHNTCHIQYIQLLTVTSLKFIQSTKRHILMGIGAFDTQLVSTNMSCFTAVKLRE